MIQNRMEEGITEKVKENEIPETKNEFYLQRNYILKDEFDTFDQFLQSYSKILEGFLNFIFFA